MSPRTNRLASERSPYLLQHSTNPVDWYPWGDEAFDRARSEGKVVFLSVGYSACHWCHVMEHESFEDEATAAILNEHFVSVKVDREERPDVDQIYQLAHQLLSQRSGGWPLSMFLTPDRRPFFGGTYFPGERRYGMPSFAEVLRSVDEAWRERREDVDAQAEELTRVLGSAVRATDGSGHSPAKGFLVEGVRKALARVDFTYGGFGKAPKFPNTMTLDLLIAASVLGGFGGDDARTRAEGPEQSPPRSTSEGDVAERSAKALEVTLDAMSRGGIRDHLGGGYARYSTDARWQVPHFEKMLYDNAQIALVMLEAGGEKRRPDIEGIFTWLSREMVSDEGAFYSAQDADSEGEEGRFFVWTLDELRSVVAGEDLAPVAAWFDVTPEGNWEHGRSVLWTPRPLERVAEAVGLSPEAVTAAVGRSVPLLFAAREKRPRPLTDDKCLAGWNALMISSLARCGTAMGRPEWVDMAKRCLDCWRARAWADERLSHAMKKGAPYGTGFLDDYGGMTLAALDVWEATGDAEAFAFARGLTRAIVARFVDESDGALCFTPSDAEVVLHRARDPYDHAYPGGVGLACMGLLRVAELTGDARAKAVAERVLAMHAGAAKDQPMGMATVLRAADRCARGAIEAIVVGDRAHPETRAMLRVAAEVTVPHRAVVCVASADEGRALGIDAELLEGRSAGEGGAPVAYVCRGTACEMPVRDAEGLRATLQRVLRA